jgi:hypothetical protein
LATPAQEPLNKQLKKKERARAARKGPLPLPSHCRSIQEDSEGLVGRLDLAGIFVGVLAVGKEDTPALHSSGHEALGHFRRAPLPCLVAVEGNQDPLGLRQDKRVKKLLGKTLHPVGRRHVLKAMRPEGERIEEGLAQDHLAGAKTRRVPEAAMRPRQVQVPYSRALVLDDLAAVGPEDRTVWPKDRDNEAAVQVLVAALAVNAQLLQPLADRGSRLPVLLGEAQAEGPVGEAKPKGALSPLRS